MTTLKSTDKEFERAVISLDGKVMHKGDIIEANEELGKIWVAENNFEGYIVKHGVVKITFMDVVDATELVSYKGIFANKVIESDIQFIDIYAGIYADLNSNFYTIQIDPKPHHTITLCGEGETFNEAVQQIIDRLKAAGLIS